MVGIQNDHAVSNRFAFGVSSLTESSHDTVVSYILWVNSRQPSVKRFALCYQTVVLSVCPVCGVGVLWPNGWMDQDETWHGGRPRPRPHCVSMYGIHPTYGR